MKKKIFALLLGGVLAVSGLFTSMPATVQAATACTNPRNHFSSWTLTPGNGQVTIQWVSNIPNLSDSWGTNNKMSLFLAEEEIEGAENVSASDLSGESFEDGGYAWSGYGYANNSSGNCTIKELTNGTTYYVYAQIYILRDASGNYIFGESEGLHTLLLVGSVTPDASLSNDPVAPAPGSSSSTSTPSGSSSSGNDSSGSAPSTSASSEDDSEEAPTYEEVLADQIKTAQSGSTIAMEKGVTTLSNSIMKELLAKGDVSMKLEFTYLDKDYVIIIPAGAALDNDIPYYGPLYLAKCFGNSAGTAGAEAGGTYEVQSGDNLSKIAAKSNMTLKQLLAKNPQIKDPNKITVGQKINR